MRRIASRGFGHKETRAALDAVGGREMLALRALADAVGELSHAVAAAAAAAAESAPEDLSRDELVDMRTEEGEALGAIMASAHTSQKEDGHTLHRIAVPRDRHTVGFVVEVRRTRMVLLERALQSTITTTTLNSPSPPTHCKPMHRPCAHTLSHTRARCILGCYRRSVALSIRRSKCYCDWSRGRGFARVHLSLRHGAAENGGVGHGRRSHGLRARQLAAARNARHRQAPSASHQAQALPAFGAR